MKTKLINGWKWLLGAVLGVLGFEGCEEIGLFRCEYGEPHADYKLVGDVKNVRKNPIPGIRVVFDRSPEMENGESRKDTLYTDANGHFEKDLPDYYWHNGAIVKFEDVDGTENGSYRTKILVNDDLVKEQTKKGDRRWYEGAFTFRADVILEEED